MGGAIYLYFKIFYTPCLSREFIIVLCANSVHLPLKIDIL